MRTQIVSAGRTPTYMPAPLDAHLAAAAPDLLAAVRALLSAKYGGDAFDRARADRAEFAARMAIAKAEGRS